MLVLGIQAKPMQHIAVVEMEGAIGTKLKPSDYVKLLRSLQEDKKVRAVVLDIDSPGGSAPGSNYLYMAVQELVKHKPVVAFIRGVGASGAYLLSCPASRIVAIPSAIIGSIGVISSRPSIYEALDHVTKSDRLKDMGSPYRPATPEEEAKEQELVDDLYDMFLDSVAEGRRMDKARVREIATGEVYTGHKAAQLGLVDELGDLERAIDVAVDLSGAPRKPVWVHPKLGLKDLMSQMVGSSLVGAVASQLEDRLLASRYDFQHR
jgi:protease IV